MQGGAPADLVRMPPGSMSLGRSAGNAHAPCRIFIVILVDGPKNGSLNHYRISVVLARLTPLPAKAGKPPGWFLGAGCSVAGWGRDRTNSAHHQTGGAVLTSVLSPIVDGLGTPVRAADPRGPGSVTGSSFPDGCMPDPKASRQTDTESSGGSTTDWLR